MPVNSVSVEIYSGITQFPCDSTALLLGEEIYLFVYFDDLFMFLFCKHAWRNNKSNDTYTFHDQIC